MIPSRRAVRLVCCLAVACVATGCAQTTGDAARPPATGTAGSAGAAPDSPTTAGPSPTAGAGPTLPGGTSFTLAEGVERDVCGIGLTVKFIPPSATTGQDDQAFLVGGPVSAVGPSPDQPAPANVAPAIPGAMATVLGKRFKVDAVDTANHRVTMEALC